MKSFTSKSLTAIEMYMHGMKSRAQRHHCLGNGVFPVDVTELNTLRKQYSKQIQPVTLMPFFVKAVALAIRDNPAANRILFQRFPFRRRIVSFDVIDVNVPVTRIVDGEQLTFVGVIRGADKLSIAEIQDELRCMQRDPLEESPYLQKMERLRRASAFALSLYHWLMSRSPSFYLKNAGTCGITVLEGMAGGLFFPIGPSTAVFAIGGIGDQVVARDGAPVVRRMMDVGLTLDNFVVGGPDGLQLALTFHQLLETCSFVKTELDEKQ